MDVEWDPAKARANLKKHGVSFTEAEAILFDPLALSMEDPDGVEQRFVTLGRDGLKRALVVVYALPSVIRFGSSRPDSPRPWSANAMRKEYDFSKARRGSVVKRPPKRRITMYLDEDILAAFRARAEKTGTGYQTLINRTLRDYLSRSATPVDAKTLRRILREELGTS